MKLNELYECVSSNVKSGYIRISGDANGAFSLVSSEITCILSKIDGNPEYIDVYDVDLSFDEKNNIFIISSKNKKETVPNLIFDSLVFTDIDINLIFQTSAVIFDADGNYTLNNCFNSFRTEYDSDNVKDTIYGELTFGKIVFKLSGTLDDVGIREYHFKKEEFDADKLISSAFNALSVALFLPEIKGIALSDIDAVFTGNTSDKKFKANDYFRVSFTVNNDFQLGNFLDISKIAFTFEKYGNIFNLGLEGRLSIYKMQPFDFFAVYQDDSYLFRLVSDNRSFGFDSISELTGISVQNNFPQEITASEGFSLNKLALKTDFKSIEYFDIELSYNHEWSFCKYPECKLEGITLRTYISENQNMFGISGIFKLFGCEMDINASYDSLDSCTLIGKIPANNFLSINTVVKELSELFGETSFTMPFDMEIVGLTLQADLKGNFKIKGMVIAGSNEDANIEKLFSGNCIFSVERTVENDSSRLTAEINGTVNICGFGFTVSYINKNEKKISAEFKPYEDDQLSLHSLISYFGSEELSGYLPECFNIILPDVKIEYDFTDNNNKKLSIFADLGKFSINAALCFGKENDYDIKISINGEINFSNIPVAGDILKNLDIDTSVKDFVIEYSKQKGLEFTCDVCGENVSCVLIDPNKNYMQYMTVKDASPASQVKWININKSISAFQLNKLGIGLDKNELSILVDASLNVSPFEFDLLETGISADVPKFDKINFVMKGFGVSFKNDTLSVSGAFYHNNTAYTGEIDITAAKLSVAVLGEYDNGSLMAYALISYPLGGPPCFYVTGLAAAFGYNNNLILPDIAKVTEFPLIAAARGDIDRTTFIDNLKKYIAPCKGQNFLAAGVRFTTFEIVKGFAIATVSFGRETEIGVLGTADIVMPPNCRKTPIAKGCLTLKMTVSPSKGLASCEARLTDDSYIFSEKCKLTGGFAFYMWFNGDHKGDFVVTLGGYHPAYKKPEHYPDIPRLGFQWDMLSEANKLVLSGELYFALTPSSIMAGGRLSVVYTTGKLKAYFIAYADFLLQWKPFKYDIAIGIALGASYRVDFWFIHHTFTIELSADLHIWGSEFSGTAHISWFIISFTIKFGSDSNNSAAPIDWREFKESFITAKTVSAENTDSADSSPLAINIQGETHENIVKADNFQADIDTVIPVKDISANGEKISAYSQDILIQPMDSTLTESLLEISLVKTESDGKAVQIDFNYSITKNNVPSALWGKKETDDELVKDVPSGISISLAEYDAVMFPKNGAIDEELLKEGEAIVRENAFCDTQTPAAETYTDENTIEIFKQTAANAATKGTELLKSLGFNGNASLSEFIKEADNLFDDNILVGSVVK